MHRNRLHTWWLVAALAPLGACLGLNGAFAQQRDADEGVHVLTRGPVHEAFAEVVTFDPEPGIVVPTAPREDIEELPPEVKPEGTNVAWIPGYWAWDDEREDFLWVSGIWRALPPGREWVPGYWGQSREGYQWTSGYWADAGTTEIDYLPEPPASIEAGPNIAAPSPDQTWTPGSWIWTQNRYAWRPGVWAPGQQDWSWMPAHYTWTPRGYVFVDGYWDYSVSRRGMLFAPVYFDSSVYQRRNYYYSPRAVISLAGLVNHLFLRPNYGHYYFGDYYGSNYSRGGFYPWFNYNSSGYGYDPFFAQQRWVHRQDRQWEERLEADFVNRRDHEEARPPRTWAAQNERIRSERSPDTAFVVATPLDQVVNNTDSPLQFEPLDETERQQIRQHGRDVQTFRQQRQVTESRAADPANERPEADSGPVRSQRTRSPIVAPSSEQLPRDHAPPQRHVAPEPDLRVEPAPRRSRDPRARQDGAPNENPQGQPRTERPGRPERGSAGQPQRGTPRNPPESAPREQPRSERPDRGERGSSGKPPQGGPPAAGTPPEQPRPERPGRGERGSGGKPPQGAPPASGTPEQPRSERPGRGERGSGGKPPQGAPPASETPPEQPRSERSGRGERGSGGKPPQGAPGESL